MASIVFIVGDTGTGKTTSLRSLEPDKTLIINVLGKDLPWRGSRNQYSTKLKNIRVVNDRANIEATIRKVLESKPEVSTFIIDDVGFTMSEEFFKKVAVKGFEKFSEIGANMQKLISFARDVVPSEKSVIFMFHTDINEVSSEYKVKTIGKLLDDKYTPLGVTAIALFTDVVISEKDGNKFSFITNRSVGDNGIVIPAKSPDGMFPQTKIPNDMQYVIDCMNAYYDGLDTPPIPEYYENKDVENVDEIVDNE